MSAKTTQTTTANGSSTAAALSAFQAKLGMAATGAADVLTQEKLFADDAPTVDER